MKIIPTPGKLTCGYAGSTTDPVTHSPNVAEYVRLVGRRPATVSLWCHGAYDLYNGGEGWEREWVFPLKQCRELTSFSTVPHVVFMPAFTKADLSPRHTLQAILGGACDAHIHMIADDIAAFDRPLLASFGCEINNIGAINVAGDGWPWVADFNGAAGPALHAEANRYWVDRIRARLRARGAPDKVAWLHWTCWNTGGPAWNDSKHYFPGSDYVAALAVGVYGFWGPYQPTWATFAEHATPAWQELDQIQGAEGLPRFLEIGCGEDLAQPLKKSQWLTDAMAKAPQLFGLAGVWYWHDRQNAVPYVGAGAIDSSPQALAAYRSGAQRATYNASVVLVEAAVPV